MTTPPRTPAGLIPLGDDEFDAFRAWIHREAGISLSPGKRALVASRVAKRLRRLGLDGYGAYLAYVDARPDEERQELINCLTTNKTEFFREPHHFRLLRDRVFPEIEARAARGGGRTVRLWSAACSTGEEPYTLAVTALEHFGDRRGWDVRVLASDIDTDVLAAAQEGLYPASSLAPLSERMRSSYFRRHENPGVFQVRPELRNLVTFRRINFMDDVWPVRTSFDAIFCRNVLIYFDRETQDRVVRRLTERLSPGGYLMLGHSEGSAALASRLTPVGGTAYRTKADGPVDGPAARPAAGRTAPTLPPSAVPPSSERPSAPAPSAPAPFRTVIVGDVFATDEPIEIRTLLGSCVAACVFDPEARVGGMNHVLLPDGRPHDPPKYAGPAVDELVRRVVRLGGDPRRLRAKLFGGARRAGPSAAPDVGGRNAESVRRRLAELGVPVVAERLGGSQAVRVRFTPRTGRVLVEPLRPGDVGRVLEAEADRIRRAGPTITPAGSTGPARKGFA